MAGKSTIEQTEMTWNPVTGCTKVSEGCRHCYAERMALRLQVVWVQHWPSMRSSISSSSAVAGTDWHARTSATCRDAARQRTASNVL